MKLSTSVAWQEATPATLIVLCGDTVCAGLSSILLSWRFPSLKTNWISPQSRVAFQYEVGVAAKLKATLIGKR